MGSGCRQMSENPRQPISQNRNIGEAPSTGPTIAKQGVCNLQNVSYSLCEHPQF